jgi:hypothetical protein
MDIVVLIEKGVSFGTDLPFLTETEAESTLNSLTSTSTDFAGRENGREGFFPDL